MDAKLLPVLNNRGTLDSYVLRFGSCTALHMTAPEFEKIVCSAHDTTWTSDKCKSGEEGQARKSQIYEYFFFPSSSSSLNSHVTDVSSGWLLVRSMTCDQDC